MLPADFWGLAGPEPDLEDLLRDPMIRALMRGDRVAPDDLKKHLRQTCRELEKRREKQAA